MPRNVVILIPARYQSSRFPGKPLAAIAGKSMIERVYHNAKTSGLPTYVVTDSELIENHVKRFGGNVLRVDDDVPSGTERIALALSRYLNGRDISYIINVQGDEPLLPGEELKRLVEFHEKNDHFDICTMVRPRLSSENDFNNPNVVKAVMAKASGQCLYFSRSSVPHSRDVISDYEWHQHIGVYCYGIRSLEFFVREKKISRLEDLEKLEQLRALEGGLTIGAIETHIKLIGVDRPEDIQKVEEALNSHDK